MNEERRPIILLPYDFTEVSKYAVKHAVGIAKQFGYSITLLNIMDISTKMYLRLSNMAQNEIQDKLNETCNFIMQTVDFKVDYFYKKGQPGSINEIAKELNVSFVVMGVDEPRSKSSPVMKMVGKSSRPVFIIQQKSDFNGYKKFLFPLDDTQTSRQKTSITARLAKVTGASINIFSMHISDSAERYKHLKIIEQVEFYFKKNEIPYSTEFAKGTNKEFNAELLDYGIANKCDLFVIMNKLPKLFAAIDPYDKQIMFNDAKIPVLCINQKDLGVGGGLT